MDHDGKCARLHGHSWIGEVEVEGNTLIRTGAKANMIIDYSELKKLIKPIEDRLDHSHLNMVLETNMPTSEFVARSIFNALKNQFPETIKLRSVTIHETCTSGCTYAEL